MLLDSGRNSSSLTSVLFLSMILLCLFRIMSCLILSILLYACSLICYFLIIIVLHLVSTILSFKLRVRSTTLVFLQDICRCSFESTFNLVYSMSLNALISLFSAKCSGSSVRQCLRQQSLKFDMVIPFKGWALVLAAELCERMNLLSGRYEDKEQGFVLVGLVGCRSEIDLKWASSNSERFDWLGDNQGDSSTWLSFLPLYNRRIVNIIPESRLSRVSKQQIKKTTHTYQPLPHFFWQLWMSNFSSKFIVTRLAMFSMRSVVFWISSST